MKAEAVLPEVTLLYDARGARPENAVGVGDFWYEPEVWLVPLSPTSKVLYAGLCSYLGHGQVNRKDLRGILKNSTDVGIATALEDLVHHGLLVSAGEVVGNSDLLGYMVRPVKELES
jgi:hypothetical protein